MKQSKYPSIRFTSGTADRLLAFVPKVVEQRLADDRSLLAGVEIDADGPEGILNGHGQPHTVDEAGRPTPVVADDAGVECIEHVAIVGYPDADRRPAAVAVGHGPTENLQGDIGGGVGA